MNLAVYRDDSVEVRQVVERCHYLHRWPDPRSLPFAYRLEVDGQRCTPDGQLCGVVVMKKPQHHRQIGMFGYPGLPTAWQVLDLARVWVAPYFQPFRHERPNRKGMETTHTLNVFSRMVGLVMRRVQADWLEHHPPVFPDLPYDILLIISYCELSHHDGTAYRACGFTKHGLTSDGSKELYYRRLRMPRKAWEPHRVMQLPMFADIPLVHGR
jgi:hypothetical protein